MTSRFCWSRARATCCIRSARRSSSNFLVNASNFSSRATSPKARAAPGSTCFTRPAKSFRVFSLWERLNASLESRSISAGLSCGPVIGAPLQQSNLALNGQLSSAVMNRTGHRYRAFRNRRISRPASVSPPAHNADVVRANLFGLASRHRPPFDRQFFFHAVNLAPFRVHVVAELAVARTREVLGTGRVDEMDFLSVRLENALVAR